MISLERAAYQAQSRVNEWVGLSTDDKTAIQETLLNGDKFLEIDTQKSYCYTANADAWVETSEGGGGDDSSVDINKVADGSLSGDIVLSTATEIIQHGLRGLNIRSISAPLVESTGPHALSYCPQLKSASLSSLKVGSLSTFIHDEALEEVELPSVQYFAGGQFCQYTAIKSVALPALAGTLSTNTFADCTQLIVVDLSNKNALPIEETSPAYIHGNAFKNCTALTTVIIRAPFMFVLTNVSAFNNCTALAHVYVPANLVDSYKAATNWSTYASIIEAIPEGV